ncbi:BAG family molecular chaperone regulator 3-like isoform X1 [Lampetra fluviatilis]
MQHQAPLPPGWEMKMEPTSGWPYFINHNEQSTTWSDPRVPMVDNHSLAGQQGAFYNGVSYPQHQAAFHQPPLNHNSTPYPAGPVVHAQHTAPYPAGPAAHGQNATNHANQPPYSMGYHAGPQPAPVPGVGPTPHLAPAQPSPYHPYPHSAAPYTTQPGAQQSLSHAHATSHVPRPHVAPSSQVAGAAQAQACHVPGRNGVGEGSELHRAARHIRRPDDGGAAVAPATWSGPSRSAQPVLIPPDARQRAAQQRAEALPGVREVNSIMAVVRSLEVEVRAFEGRRSDKAYLVLEEMLTKEVLKLDTVDTGGHEEVRQARKQAIREVQAILEHLELKAQIFEG